MQYLPSTNMHLIVSPDSPAVSMDREVSKEPQRRHGNKMSTRFSYDWHGVFWSVQGHFDDLFFLIFFRKILPKNEARLREGHKRKFRVERIKQLNKSLSYGIIMYT